MTELELRLAMTEDYVYLDYAERREYSDTTLGYFESEELALRALSATEQYLYLFEGT